MTDKEFLKYWKKALEKENRKEFLEECRKEESYTADMEHMLISIHKVAHMQVKEIVTLSGVSQKRFAERYCIPLRTLEQWCTGLRKCNDYIRLLLCRQEGHLDNVPRK